jgi:Mn-dependent DtxR family transcriptional regulator
MAISNNLESYIEVVYELCQEHKHAHTKSIAEKMNVKMSSAAEAIANLSSAGLVNYSIRKPVTLTEKGRLMAEHLQKKHRILEKFFTAIGCDSELAERTACKVEHIIDDKVADLIEKHLKKLAGSDK